MSRLGKVLANLGEKYELGGETFLLKSLTGKSIGLFEKDTADSKELPYLMVHASLSESDSEITLDEVKGIPFVHIAKMAELVMVASGFDPEEIKDKIEEETQKKVNE